MFNSVSLCNVEYDMYACFDVNYIHPFHILSCDRFILIFYFSMIVIRLKFKYPCILFNNFSLTLCTLVLILSFFNFSFVKKRLSFWRTIRNYVKIIGFLKFNKTMPIFYFCYKNEMLWTKNNIEKNNKNIFIDYTIFYYINNK